MAFTTLRRWLNSTTRRRPAARRSSFLPRLEGLEGRALPTVFTVTTLADAGAGSLRQALLDADAATGDQTVRFAAGLTGTIQLASALPNLGRAGASNLSLEGPGADLLTVHRNTAGEYRVFTVATNTTVSVSGLTVAGGKAEQGGGIYVTGGHFTLTDCVLAGDLAAGHDAAANMDGNEGAGGGLYVAGGTATVLRTTFSADQALGGHGGNSTLEAGSGGDGSGGAVYVAAGTLSVTACAFSADQATGGVGGTGTRAGAVGGDGGSGVGGGLYVAAGTTSVASTTFSGALATGGDGGPGGGVNDGGGGGWGLAGGLYVGAGSRVSVDSGALSGGRAASGVGDRVDAEGTGGGIFNDGGMLTATACTFAGNSAAGELNAYGGGIDNDSGTLTLTACTLTANTVAPGNADFAFGGGIQISAGTVALTACTLAGNSAGDEGGGIENNGGTLTVTACTITGNSAPDAGGGGIFNEVGTLRLFGTLVAGNTTDVAGLVPVDGSSSYNLIGIGGSGGLLDGANHNQVGVGAPGLGTLGDYGGPTPTVALLAGSPALNAGDPALLGSADQRGLPRGGGVNVGAYQASASALVLAAPASAVAGAPFAVTVAAQDAFGQTAVGYTGTVALTSTDPQNPTLDQHAFTLADGGSFTSGGELLFSAGLQTLTAGDGASSATLGLLVVPGAATQLVLSATPDVLAGVSVGVPFQVTVTAYDAYGNVATGYGGTVTFGSDDPAGVLPADYPFQPGDQGSATFSVTLNTPGPVHLSASDAAAGLSSSLDLMVS